MNVDALRNFLFRYKVHHILLWISVFVFWREYYRLVDPHEVIVANTFMVTCMAAIAFYIPYLYLVPAVLNKKGISPFILSVLLVLLVLVPLRSFLIYLSFRFYLPGTDYWSYFRSFTASFFHIGYALTIGTVVRLIADRYDAQRKLDALAKEKLGTELDYLKHQINPHFLFNIHNSIYFLINENPAAAAEAILKFSHIMRYQLYDCSGETVMVSREIENLKNYVDLEKMRLGNAVQIECTDEIISGGRGLHPFILITLVENSFKHVGSPEEGKAKITIAIKQQEEWLYLTAINTVSEDRKVNGAPAGGIGLQNLKRRLQLLYEKDHSLETYKETGLFTAKLKIKLQ